MSPPVEFPRATWTSFDRHSRYGAIARALRATRGPGPLRVLDVGDGVGYLSAFDSGSEVVCLDLTLPDQSLGASRRILGDGTRLPVPDRSFDVVVSSDALEHVPVELRPTFVRELMRASRDLVLVAAPFDTPGVAATEDAVKRFVLLATGTPQEQLEEHAAFGLPGLEETERVFVEGGMRVAVAGAGNLFDWLTMMLVKHQVAARPALRPLEDGYDIAYNALFSGRDGTGPFYRHLVAARRDGDPNLGAVPRPIDGTPADISGMMATIASVNVAEAVRQDTHHRLGVLDRRLEESLAQLDATVVQAIGRIEARVTETERKVDALIDMLRHPIAHASGRLRRLATPGASD